MPQLVAFEERIAQSRGFQILRSNLGNIPLIDKDRPERGDPNKPPKAVVYTTLAFGIYAHAQRQGRAQVLECVRRLWREECREEAPAHTAELFPDVETIDPIQPPQSPLLEGDRIDDANDRRRFSLQVRGSRLERNPEGIEIVRLQESLQLGCERLAQADPLEREGCDTAPGQQREKLCTKPRVDKIDEELADLDWGQTGAARLRWIE